MSKEEETRKRNEDARRIAQEAEGWLKGEEEEKRRAAQEAARKVEEDAKSEDEEKKIKMDEELKKEEAERLNMIGTMIEQSVPDIIDSQAQDLGNPDIQDLEAAAASTTG